MSTKIDDIYVMEKIEAYNVAISCLRHHESASGENEKLSYRLRSTLADKLQREVERWYSKHAPTPAAKRGKRT